MWHQESSFSDEEGTNAKNHSNNVENSVDVKNHDNKHKDNKSHNGSINSNTVIARSQDLIMVPEPEHKNHLTEEDDVDSYLQVPGEDNNDKEVCNFNKYIS